MRLGIISKILDNKWIESTVIVSMIVVVSMIIFTPDLILIRKLSSHAFEAVILFLASAMVFMILEKPKIMFACLAMAMMLSLYLKDKSKSGIPSYLFGKSNDFSICQVMISGGSDQYQDFTTQLLSSNADIIQVQETTPDWIEVLKNSLYTIYPYRSEMNRIDPYGMMIYSKYPIKKIDTLLCVDTVRNFSIPVLKVLLEIQGKEVDFISCHILPRLNNTDFEKVQEILKMISTWIKNNPNRNIIVSGELGLTPWDYALQQFIGESGLQISRREPHLFVQPFEHIFYSNDIDCLKLKEILAPGRNHMGIQGSYSFKKSN